MYIFVKNEFIYKLFYQLVTKNAQPWNIYLLLYSQVRLIISEMKIDYLPI